MSGIKRDTERETLPEGDKKYWFFPGCACVRALCVCVCNPSSFPLCFHSSPPTPHSPERPSDYGSMLAYRPSRPWNGTESREAEGNHRGGYFGDILGPGAVLETRRQRFVVIPSWWEWQQCFVLVTACKEKGGVCHGLEFGKVSFLYYGNWELEFLKKRFGVLFIRGRGDSGRVGFPHP